MVAPAVVRVRAFQREAHERISQRQRSECERAYSSLDSRAVCGPEAPFTDISLQKGERTFGSARANTLACETRESRVSETRESRVSETRESRVSSQIRSNLRD